ncbi:MAG: threonylcarbamoyl-AMP synthase [Desulfobacteraceae bacterium]|nr:threonylcarbamoyl-AMP synthase [Desulfobacteraceae bacterium]
MKDKPQIARIDPLSPDPGLIRRAADIITIGGLVIYPTRNLYGLGVKAANPGAVKKVFEVKNRAPDNPVSILISDRGALNTYAADVSDAARSIMDRFWPGGITLVFRAQPDLPRRLTAGTQTVGIRLPAHPVATALVKAAGTAITATSANLSGHFGVRGISDIGRQLTEAVDLVLDAGTLEPGEGSTILDVTCDPPRVIREGWVTANDLRALMQITD